MVTACRTLHTLPLPWWGVLPPLTTPEGPGTAESALSHKQGSILSSVQSHTSTTTATQLLRNLAPVWRCVLRGFLQPHPGQVSTHAHPSLEYGSQGPLGSGEASTNLTACLHLPVPLHFPKPRRSWRQGSTGTGLGTTACTPTLPAAQSDSGKSLFLLASVSSHTKQNLELDWWFSSFVLRSPVATLGAWKSTGAKPSCAWCIPLGKGFPFTGRNSGPTLPFYSDRGFQETREREVWARGQWALHPGQVRAGRARRAQ